MPQAFVRKHHRIDQDLLAEVFARELGAGAVAAAKRSAGRVRPPQVRWQIASGVGRADTHTREAVQRSLDDQMGQRDGRLQRVADGVAQASSRAVPETWTEGMLSAVWMHEQR